MYLHLATISRIIWLTQYAMLLNTMEQSVQEWTK